MNILVCANGPQREIPRHLSEQCDLGDVHIISDKRPAYEHKAYHHFRECTFGRFRDLDKYSSIPLDSEILAGLSVCESHALKMMERYRFNNGLFSYEGRINLYHKQIKYWYNYLVKNEIKLCILTVIPHVVFDYLIYCVCKYLGIRTIMFYRTTVLVNENISLYLLEDIVQQSEELNRRYQYHLENPRYGELSSRVEAYLSLRDGTKGKTFTGVSTRRLGKYFSPKAYVHYMAYKIAFIKEWLSHVTPADLMARALRKCGRRKASKFSFDERPDLKCRYIYVSLHYQPECSTSPLGGYYVHQDLMLDVLVSAVPKEIKLYVKGHKRGGVDPELRERLSVDGRTVFIDPSYDSFPLIENSLAVATITGTAGWEAFINKKPVLMFGNYFYQDAPGVFKINSVKDGGEAVTNVLSGSCVITDEMVFAFLKAVDDISFPGWVDNRYSTMSGLTDEENCKNIAAHIGRRIAGHSL